LRIDFTIEWKRQSTRFDRVLSTNVDGIEAPRLMDAATVRRRA
jgi:hypothetical protein